jgi:hypothetical protein
MHITNHKSTFERVEQNSFMCPWQGFEGLPLSPGLISTKKLLFRIKNIFLALPKNYQIQTKTLT